MAGFTGLHNCDPEDVTSHARDVITDLVTTCLEDISDQEISVAAMTCITTLLTAPDVTNNTCLDPVYPELCTRVKSFLYTETGDTCPEQQAAALSVLQHVSLVTSGRDLEVVTICLILASSSHEITREEVIRTLTAIGEVSQYGEWRMATIPVRRFLIIIKFRPMPCKYLSSLTKPKYETMVH